MRVLHITNSYGGTAVYTNLYTAIDRNSELEQLVYVPLNCRNHNRVGNMQIDFKNKNSKIHYSTLLKKYHTFLYGLKIHAVLKDIELTFDMTKVDIIHASTLCFDGAVAYELSKKYDIPYILAVRNTDVHTYYDKLFWRRSYFTKILLKAHKIIFISPKYKDNFVKNNIPSDKIDLIKDKMVVIPNGVSNIFLRNEYLENKSLGNDFRLIFVAAFYRGKGLVETIQAVNKLRSEGVKISLNAIGRGLPNRPQDTQYIKDIEHLADGKDWILLQPFKKPQEIIEEMRKADAFIMVSSPETFGLVYIEALTQKLPIIYAHNEGFDGFYEEGFVGYPAFAGDVDDILKKIKQLISNYKKIQDNISSLNLNIDFNWDHISKKYIKMYYDIKVKK